MMKISIGAAAATALVLGFLSFAGAASAASVMKECGEEWKALKAANNTNGQSWQDFLKSCRAKKGDAAAPDATTSPAPAPADSTPAPSPAASSAEPTPAPAAVTPSPKPTKAAPAPKKTPVAATGAGEFANEAEAKSHCPSDTVVWVNTKSHKYHYSGHRSYGTTKQGAYMCEADAKAAGDAASKEEHPPKP